MSPTKEIHFDMQPLDEILSSRPKIDSCELIPILQQIQKAYGYLPAEVLEEFSNRSSIPASRIYGVVTFYEQFYLTPHGRHTIRCCRGTACHVRSASGVIAAVEKELGIKAGETTEDMEFSFETVACLGVCALAPVLVIDGTYYGQMTPSGVKKILEDYMSVQKEAN